MLAQANQSNQGVLSLLQSSIVNHIVIHDTALVGDSWIMKDWCVKKIVTFENRNMEK